MKKIGFCLIMCLLMITQIANVYAKAEDAISSEIDRNFPRVSVQFGKTKVNVGNELTLRADKVNKNIWFAGNQIQSQNLEVSNLVGAGGVVHLDETTKSQFVLMAGEQLDIKGTYEKLYLSGADVLIASKSETLYVAGDTIEFTGTTSNATLAANTVIIDGKITGQLKIAATNIEIKDGAKIEGNIKIWSDNKATLPGKMTEEQITYYKPTAIKWGFLPSLSFINGSNSLTYGILVVTSLLLGTLGLPMGSKVLALFKEKNWKQGIVQLLILLSDPVILALALIVFLNYTVTHVLVMYIAMWLAMTPILTQRLIGKGKVKKRMLLLLSVFSIVLFEWISLYSPLGWWLFMLSIVFTMGTVGIHMVKNKKIVLKVKP